MGKNLIQQARGKGSPRYRSPSFKFKGAVKHRKEPETLSSEGIIMDLVKCRGHSAPLALIEYNDGEFSLSVAPEGIRIGQTINYGPNVSVEAGNTSMLKNIPEGTLVYNIESKPGDGGKFCRASGTAAKVSTKTDSYVTIIFPSKKKKMLPNTCRASIGVVAGGGRVDKPFLKAGKKHHKMKAKNKLYPIVSGSAQNAVDHPFGNKRTSRKSKAKPVPHNAPPGRKVGMLRPKRTGRRKK
jgi:large subunit ribosomal protein L2